MVKRGHYESLTGKESADCETLCLDEVSKKFGKRSVLKFASLTVFKNEIMVLIGENGAGKTMMMKSIAGCLHGLSGSLHFGSTNLAKSDIRFSENLTAAAT